MLTCDMTTVVPWVTGRVDGVVGKEVAAIGWLKDDKLTCGVTYSDFTKKSITATIAIDTGATVPKDFMWAIFDYPFNQLNVFKIFAHVAESNAPSQKLVERMGFIVEAKITDYYPDGGVFIYSMTREQCRWLEK